MVLDRPGEDLGGRGGAAVDQHHEGEAELLVDARGVVGAVGAANAAAGLDDLALTRHELIGNFDRLVE